MRHQWFVIIYLLICQVNFITIAIYYIHNFLNRQPSERSKTTTLVYYSSRKLIMIKLSVRRRIIYHYVDMIIKSDNKKCRFTPFLNYYTNRLPNHNLDIKLPLSWHQQPTNCNRNWLVSAACQLHFN